MPLIAQSSKRVKLNPDPALIPSINVSRCESKSRNDSVEKKETALEEVKISETTIAIKAKQDYKPKTKSALFL